MRSALAHFSLFLVPEVFYLLKLFESKIQDLKKLFQILSQQLMKFESLKQKHPKCQIKEHKNPFKAHHYYVDEEEEAVKNSLRHLKKFSLFSYSTQ